MPLPFNPIAQYLEHVKYATVAKKNEQTQRRLFRTHDQEIVACDIEEDFLMGLPIRTIMIAGATAGMMEHFCMFPVDTIKTRIQTSAYLSGVPTYRSVGHAAIKIARSEGLRRLYRGVTAIIMAAIPSHALYFGTYELGKEKLGCNEPGYHPIKTAVVSGGAAMLHDFIATPLDVIKQRLQVYNSGYSGVVSCAKNIFREEGMLAFYASYPTTVLMNVPFMAVNFVTYESMKTLFLMHNPEEAYGVPQELFAGGCAGALAGFITTPLDVIKTRIQTQHVPCTNMKYSSCRAERSGFGVCKLICKEEGYKGFTRGGMARIIYFMPSVAIVWTTYETMKKVFGIGARPYETLVQ